MFIFGAKNLFEPKLFLLVDCMSLRKIGVLKK